MHPSQWAWLIVRLSVHQFFSSYMADLARYSLLAYPWCCATGVDNGDYQGPHVRWIPFICRRYQYPFGWVTVTDIMRFGFQNTGTRIYTHLDTHVAGNTHSWKHTHIKTHTYIHTLGQTVSRTQIQRQQCPCRWMKRRLTAMVTILEAEGQQQSYIYICSKNIPSHLSHICVYIRICAYGVWMDRASIVR